METKLIIALFFCIIYNYSRIMEGSESLQQTTDIVIYFIKTFILNIFVYFSFCKILNMRINNKKESIVIFVANIILSSMGTYIEFFVNSFLALIIILFPYGIILSKLTKNTMGYSIVITAISYAICEICYVISVIITYLEYYLFKVNNDYFTILIMLLQQGIILYLIFKIKRLRNGFDFLQRKLNKDYIDIIVINVSVIVIMIYCLIGTIYDEIILNLLISVVLFAIAMFVIIQKTFVMHYKQKLLKDTIKQYEEDLKEKDQEIKKLSEERYEISRINHEFYNRQKALEQKVKEMETEASNEIGVIDRIENLTKEYSKSLEDIKGKDKLPLTEIPEIDDMFKYMQTECSKNNIEFKLHIESEIYHLINKIIPKNKLETLIGDHLRNAIIAINSSKNKNKSILVMLGKIEGKYELCIYDSGIEFEIKTLEKLGTERITTHKETGGSGIGFMTTFQTLKECKASLVIEEKHKESENDYTKAIKIKFDGKNEYKIISYRAEKLKKEIEDGLTKVKILDEIAESKESVKL